METETYSEHCQTFKTYCFAKIRMLGCKHTIRSFKGSRGFMELQLFDKQFVNNTSKKLQLHFEWKIYSKDEHNQNLFVQN